MTFHTIDDALELLKKRKGIELSLYSCSLVKDKSEILELYTGGRSAVVPKERMELHLSLRTFVDNQSAPNYQLDYVIFADDIEGRDEIINKYVGDLSNIDEETKQTLRLAWIILNGYRRAVERTTLKDFQSRIVSYSSTVF